ncbi:hypothetical protein F4805DRAFT_439541 [Annulohypoxylon moriforme]|nr:hypothetical protein F4805DRAFT_439541 [Annulohypoxylon moriforme]
MYTRSQNKLSSSTASAAATHVSSRLSTSTSTQTPSPRRTTSRKTVQQAPRKPKAKLLEKRRVSQPVFPGQSLLGSSTTSTTSGPFEASQSPEAIEDWIEVKPTNSPSKPPRTWKIYMDGVNGRVHSIIDTKTHTTLYHHERDADQPVRMSLLNGKVEYVENAQTGHVFYQSPNITL